MNELELKYGCNPNQKPAKIYMADGSDLPLTILNGRPGYINFLDALNGIAYDDDAQINILNISKRYGEKPMLRITIKEK